MEEIDELSTMVRKGAVTNAEGDDVSFFILAGLERG